MVYSTQARQLVSTSYPIIRTPASLTANKAFPVTVTPAVSAGTTFSGPLMTIQISTPATQICVVTTIPGAIQTPASFSIRSVV